MLSYNTSTYPTYKPQQLPAAPKGGGSLTPAPIMFSVGVRNSGKRSVTVETSFTELATRNCCICRDNTAGIHLSCYSSQRLIVQHYNVDSGTHKEKQSCFSLWAPGRVHIVVFSKTCTRSVSEKHRVCCISTYSNLIWDSNSPATCVVSGFKLTGFVQTIIQVQQGIHMDNNNLTGSWKSIPLRLWSLKGGVFNTHHIYMYITAVSVITCTVLGCPPGKWIGVSFQVGGVFRL